MTRLALIFLSASAVASVANAQSRAEPPVKWEDTPNMQLKVPGASGVRPARAPGVSWQQAPAAPQIRTQVAPAPRPTPQVRTEVSQVPQAAPPQRAAPGDVRHVRVLRREGAPQAPVRFEMRRTDEQAPMAHGGQEHMQRDVIIRPGADRMVRRHHSINRYPDYRRIDRGLMLPQHWWGPRFHIMNWGMYGLPQPIHGGRWVRYYDDALLVDGQGRVHDGRWGMRWDEYRDQWSHDDRGIPIYVGNGGFRPDGRDYAWVEGRQGHSGAYGYGQHQQGYGYPGYGYGHGYGGMVVTETTVTTSPTVIQTTVYEDAVQSAPRRSYRKKARRVASKTRCIC